MFITGADSPDFIAKSHGDDQPGAAANPTSDSGGPGAEANAAGAADGAPAEALGELYLLQILRSIRRDRSLGRASVVESHLPVLPAPVRRE